MGARTRQNVYYVALAVSFVLGLATLWCVDYLPTNDGPQHIFLGHVENFYSDPTAIYGRQLVPQVQFASHGFSLWWTPLEPLLGYRDATRVVLSLFYSWTFAGYVLIVHALGPARRWLSLLGSGVALCWPLYMGLLPYYGGLGLGLLVVGFVARRSTFDRRTALVVGGALLVQFVHHAFSVVPTLFFVGILVVARAERAERRGTFVRLALAVTPAALLLISLVVFRPPSPPSMHEFHWEPLARRALILPRVLWSGAATTRWVGNALVLVGLVASIARFRRAEPVERAYAMCAWTAGALLVTLPIVIPGWQFFNVRFAAFFVAFTLPLIPLERLRGSVSAGAAACGAAATCFVIGAFSFHRALHASCADDLAGLSLPVKRTGFRFPLVLEPFCGLPRDATQSPVPFLGPARSLDGLYAAAQGGTIPNAFASVFAIHSFAPRTGDDAVRVPIPDEAVLHFGEERSNLDDPAARRHELETVAILAQSYDDVLVFGGTSPDVDFLEQLGFRAAFRQGSFAMLALEPCRIVAVIEDHPKASAIVVGGGLGGRPEITWERAVKPGSAPEGDGALVAPVGQRLCGPGWINVRYRIGDTVFPCANAPNATDGKLSYVAKPGEVTRVRCAAPAP